MLAHRPLLIKRSLFLLLLSLLLLGCRDEGRPPASPPATTPAATSIPTQPANTPTAISTATPSQTPAEPTSTLRGTPQEPTPAATSTPTPTPEPLTVRFAVIGDYGQAGPAEAAVADLVKSREPDLIITTGDNNYPDGQASTIDDNIGQYYAGYIHPYQGAYGPGAAENRFFPSPGNHDWNTPDLIPYLDYFTLPGNERYYDFVRGPVHFFALDSDSREPDGVSADSIQAGWLRDRLAASDSPWKIVYMHQPAYSSGRHGSTEWMRWPFAEWGASAVLAGHDHVYERLIVNGLPYFTSGLGGHPARYIFLLPHRGSQLRYNDDYGALFVEATETELVFEFANVAGEVIDRYVLEGNRR